MAPADPDSPAFLVRVAVRFGSTLGEWRRSRAQARDDAFVAMWKAAWNAGCDAYSAGKTINDAPYRRAAEKQAWLAGWAWAAQQRGKS